MDNYVDLQTFYIDNSSVVFTNYIDKMVNIKGRNIKSIIDFLKEYVRENSTVGSSLERIWRFYYNDKMYYVDSVLLTYNELSKDERAKVEDRYILNQFRREDYLYIKGNYKKVNVVEARHANKMLQTILV